RHARDHRRNTGFEAETGHDCASISPRSRACRGRNRRYGHSIVTDITGVTMRASLAIENFLEMMSAERGAAENTLESYRRDLEAVADVLAARGVNLTEAGPDHIRSAIDAMATEGFAATSQARRLSALRQFFRFLYSEGYREDDPTGTVDAP